MSKEITQQTTGQARPIEYTTPAVDIHQDGDGYVVEVELPGVSKSGVDLTFEDGKLIIIGHREQKEKGGRVLLQEIRPADYRRVFDLDPTIDPSSIQATIEQGLLRIRLQKAEAHKPRKISIN
ncbi:MAG: Hsp20/alpha crystallin family protein [Chthoniobacterales bacterium]|nr:Hsp20/alpha crystallin family protein [Chthoniobacterales bacterium]